MHYYLQRDRTASRGSLPASLPTILHFDLQRLPASFALKLKTLLDQTQSSTARC